MSMVSAKAMWWTEPVVCSRPDDESGCYCDTEGGWCSDYTRMLCGEINGWLFITDRFVLLPVSRLGELPVGYSKVLGLQPLSQRHLDGFADLMGSHVTAAPSDRMFLQHLLDPIEKAGLIVRPIVHVKEIHAVCDPDLSVVGLLQPLKRGIEHGANSRRAAA